MATPKPQIRNLFATPVCLHYLPVAHEVNGELRRLIFDKMGSRAVAEEFGWRSLPDFEDWGGAHVQTLFRVLRELADSMTATRGGGRVSLDWKIAASAAVRQKGEHAELHTRQRDLWSGVYYVDDGYGKSDDESLGGECELADPRGTLHADIAPQYGFRIPGGVHAGLSETIRPQTGMILLHPSWLPRGERRYDGAGQRVTVEFDLSPPKS
jgi:hypothetical protein